MASKLILSQAKEEIVQGMTNLWLEVIAHDSFKQCYVMGLKFLTFHAQNRITGCFFPRELTCLRVQGFAPALKFPVFQEDADQITKPIKASKHRNITTQVKCGCNIFIHSTFLAINWKCAHHRKMLCELLSIVLQNLLNI